MEIYVWKKEDESIRFLDGFYSSVSELIGRLPGQRFVQCSRTHIVNLGYIKRIGGNSLTLMDKSETEMKMGRGFSENVRDAYMKFKRDRYE